LHFSNAPSTRIVYNEDRIAASLTNRRGFAPMKPSQPDDAGSPSPGKPRRPEQKPLAPAIVYALDCLERTTAAQVRRHMASLGYTPEEAAEAVRAALAHRSGDSPSAWSREDNGARRCMSLGFLLFVCGIIIGCGRVLLLDYLPPPGPVVLNVVAWGCILTGVIVFWFGIAQKRARMR
jgi:hypothetical protein